LRCSLDANVAFGAAKIKRWKDFAEAPAHDPPRHEQFGDTIMRAKP
jgi:hypothetical protein